MRIINTIRCIISYILSLVGIVRVRHLPTFVSVEPANYCQLRCPECPVGMRMGNDALKTRHEKGVMTMEMFEHILHQIASHAHTLQFYFQGEPLLNKQLSEMIAKAHQAKLYTIVSTNAQALTRPIAEALVKSGLNRIIVSIDGFSEQSYAAYRVGGNLHRALEGLSFLSEAREQYRSSICIELQVLRLRTNEHEWQWIKRNYRQLGATRLVFKTAQLYNYTHGHPLMTTKAQYSRYRRAEDGTYHLHRSWLRRHWWNTPCYRLWAGCVITTEGKVLPCCYDKTSSYAFGTLQQDSLATIWHDKKADSFRHHVLRSSNDLSICQECNH